MLQIYSEINRHFSYGIVPYSKSAETGVSMYNSGRLHVAIIAIVAAGHAAMNLRAVKYLISCQF